MSGCVHEWVLAEAHLVAGGADQVMVCVKCPAVAYSPGGQPQPPLDDLPDD